MRTSDNVPLAGDTVRLIADARQESIRMGHPYIGTEHLLLALTGSHAESPLVELGVDVTRVRRLVEEIVKRDRNATPDDLNVPFTSRTKQVFVYAEEAARDLGQPRVDVGHVVYGIMREQHGIAAQVLYDGGLTAELVEAKIRHATDRGGA